MMNVESVWNFPTARDFKAAIDTQLRPPVKPLLGDVLDVVENGYHQLIGYDTPLRVLIKDGHAISYTSMLMRRV